MEFDQDRLSRTTLIFVIIAGLLVFGVYAPGLGGPFMLDDLHNLSKLEDIEGLGTGYFVFSGISSFLGRPLALLTFAWQHQAWPDPYPFKLVNLFIHIVNGFLLFLVSRLLLRAMQASTRATALFSLLLALVWLLHPVHLSTVLYTIQRMTLLSAFFTLAGILGYLHFRLQWTGQAQSRQFIAMGIWVSLCMLLAILCKENGILLALYILVIEFTLLGTWSVHRSLRILQGIFLYIPLLLLVVYLAVIFDSTLTEYQNRSFTIGERLLTECNVLVDYLKILVFPSPGSFTFFYDDYPVASSVLHPVSTLFSILLLTALLVSAFVLRLRFPVYSFSILWFFSGHLLESTYIPLELYFEHRNYLPSIGVITLLLYAFSLVWKNFTRKRIILVLCGLYLLLLSTGSYFNARLWGNEVALTQEWVREHPKSLRALQALNLAYLHYGRYEEAIGIYADMLDLYPEDLYLRLYGIAMEGCLFEEDLSPSDWQKTMEVAGRSDSNKAISVGQIDSMIIRINQGQCVKVNPYNLIYVLLSMKQNPHYVNRQDEIHEHLALLSLIVDDREAALVNINESLHFDPSPQRYVLKFRILMEMGRTEEARETLQILKSMKTEKPHEIMAYQKVIKVLEQSLP